MVILEFLNKLVLPANPLLKQASIVAGPATTPAGETEEGVNTVVPSDPTHSKVLAGSNCRLAGTSMVIQYSPCPLMEVRSLSKVIRLNTKGSVSPTFMEAGKVDAPSEFTSSVLNVDERVIKEEPHNKLNLASKLDPKYLALVPQLSTQHW